MLDGIPCKRCGAVPEVSTKRIRVGNRIEIIADRSNRIDCDASNYREPSKYEVFHNWCWKDQILEEAEKDEQQKH